MKINLGLRIPPEDKWRLVCRESNVIETETDLLANECHFVVVNSILRHHIKNPSILFRR